MTYRGVVRGKVVELKSGVALPEGTEVTVSVKGKAPRTLPGSPQALLAALQAAPRCGPDDVDALTQAIAQGKRLVQFGGPFDRKRARR